ncbi:hypothetical protein [Chryseolinea sp. H1M3-3]|uniref:tetratricopeptide repeat protein n=1 Tax=Chryseolinea sp. H1M3-3 TaxID=3034144 RepID=UPI0023EDCD1E|nr:hypothetical protein [Chryseolinea sp. H1M3-3]
MTKFTLIQFLFLSLVVSAAFGQKVKYKDIFSLLNTKRYEEAEPFLKRYLKETDDNPNAYLYMGIIYQEKSAKDDVLKQTKRSINNMDSAIYFYDKAFKSITEKELKRNDEFYQAYNRRDLRTGEFGVKLSDIQFDLEKKMEGLRERIDRVKMVKHYFTLADTLYKRCVAAFTSIKKAYPEEQSLYLRADENLLKKLNALAVRFDSCVKTFENYRSSSTTIGRTGYDQALSLNDINNYATDGTSPANFFLDDVEVWNYRKFADLVKVAVEKDVFPMRDMLVSYDVEINKLREKLNKDSVSVKNELTKLIDKLLLEKLKKYDKDPLPMDVFTLKVSDLEYRSTLLEHKSHRDSADIHYRRKLLQEELQHLNKLDSIATKMMGEDIDREAEDYAHFITSAYSNTVVLKSYIKALKEYAEREKRKKASESLQIENALRWIIAASDSIPAMADASSMKYKPLVIVEEKYTAGLHYTDSVEVSGYFATIVPSRVIDIKVDFPVDKQNFKLQELDSIKGIVSADAGGQLYFVLLYNEKETDDGKIAATVAKIYRSDGLAWSTNYQLDFVPTEILFKPETSELTLKGDTQQNVLDKNGKLK